MIPISNPAPSASSSIGPAVGGAVGGLIAVIIIIAVVVIALLLIMIKRGQKGSLKVNDRKESVQGYNNALYDGKQNTQSDE
jgi:predicted metalloprotease